MKIVVTEICRDCHGQGHPEGYPLLKCTYCKGSCVHDSAITLEELAKMLREMEDGAVVVKVARATRPEVDLSEEPT